MSRQTLDSVFDRWAAESRPRATAKQQLDWHLL